MSLKHPVSFWRVFWVVAACYLFILLLGIVGMVVTSSEEHPVRWHYIFNMPHLANQGVNILVSSLFLFFAINFYWRFFTEKRGFFYYLRFSVIAGVLYAAMIYTKAWLMLDFQGEGSMRPSPAMLFFSTVVFTLMHVGVGVLVAYLRFLRDERKQRKILEEQKMQLELEKSSANLNFLKAQINPHFLHNTLNFLYAKSLPYSPELSEGILTLSDIMRYALSEGNAKDGKAPLKDEIEHVWNVIKINQLRFSNKLNVDFQVNGVVNGTTIIPFALITIVENAFKHGDLKNEEYPIRIRLDIDEERLRFYCTNRKKAGPKELSTGVGLDNIKKRLELAYGTRYRFDIRDEAETYTSELTIDQI